MRVVMLWLTVVSLCTMGVAFIVTSALEGFYGVSIRNSTSRWIPFAVEVLRCCEIAEMILLPFASLAGAVYLILLDRHVRRSGGAGFAVLQADGH